MQSRVIFQQQIVKIPYGKTTLVRLADEKYW